MTLKRPNIFIWITLAAAWFFDYLFWGKIPGISIALFIFTLLAAGLTVARIQGLAPAKKTLWLLLPIAYFTVMTSIRLEPLTTFLNVVSALLLMAVFAHSFRGGQWWQYSFKDYLVTLLAVPINAIIRPMAVFISHRKKREAAPRPQKANWRGVFAVLRGLLFALPIVLVLAVLLAEADPIFEQQVEALLDFFKIYNLGEYIFRAIYISIFAYLLSGVYLHALRKDHDEAIPGDRKPWLPRFLGFTESAIVLGSVNLLFLVFVAVQIRYFFGGQVNISATGYTYAEYARRGFGELVLVAMISLLVFLVLSTITKRQEARQPKVFSAFATALMAQVGVILTSSYQRLGLYEQAYGFTRLRTYSHVFILWLGVLLLAVVVLELSKRQRHFALATLVACTGFVVSINSLNVDAFIARRNVSRARQEEPAGDEGPWVQKVAPIDIAYLASLSEDVIPTLSDLYDQAHQSGDQVEEALAGALACHAALNKEYEYHDDHWRTYTWRSFHFSRYAAQRDWQARQEGDSSQVFTLIYREDFRKNPWKVYVLVDGQKVDCQTGRVWD